MDGAPEASRCCGFLEHSSVESTGRDSATSCGDWAFGFLRPFQQHHTRLGEGFGSSPSEVGGRPVCEDMGSRRLQTVRSPKGRAQTHQSFPCTLKRRRRESILVRKLSRVGVEWDDVEWNSVETNGLVHPMQTRFSSFVKWNHASFHFQFQGKIGVPFNRPLHDVGQFYELYAHDSIVRSQEALGGIEKCRRTSREFQIVTVNSSLQPTVAFTQKIQTLHLQISQL